ncbi:EI24 domain-containing protein [Limobrevibacterium gyesilva]|uniref:EI24 domain-containing protein n=1 Tax=Limobrevibacterium gyesilva TaxID=2991712 RepID=A0AA41YQD2_9PROT|nr:EI24 domain-containing protein [Limobrevibacterium gyesilva]MCW3477759.1 EI24 domain-containing protein [Limobrevibacterium gyesilva]
MLLLAPPLRAIAQFHDRAFLGVVIHSVAWAALSFALLTAGIVWGAHAALADQGWWSWLAALLGGVGSAILALFLFLPLATVIASLFVDRIADAVERRFYPGLPPAHPAPLAQQVWDGVVLGLRVLVMQIVALVLTLLLPGVGLVLGWVVAAWAIGRGLFVAVAMRRMDRAAASALYRRRRLAVLAQGGLMTAGSLVPLLNLLAPVLGTAAMVHVLHATPGDAGEI